LSYFFVASSKPPKTPSGPELRARLQEEEGVRVEFDVVFVERFFSIAWWIRPPRNAMSVPARRGQ
jgi:hypothetical protein